MATLVPSPAIQQDRQTNGLYERDFYSWSMQQADALKRRDFNAVDWENVIEEIADLGKTQQHNWEAFCARVIEHMLKIDYYREASEKVLEHWTREIRDFRQEMAELIDKNPGLKGQYAKMFAAAWERGRGYACRRLAEYDEDNDPQTTWKKSLPRTRAHAARRMPLPARRRDGLQPAARPRARLRRLAAKRCRVLNARLDVDLAGRRAHTADSGIGRDR